MRCEYLCEHVSQLKSSLTERLSPTTYTKLRPKAVWLLPHRFVDVSGSDELSPVCYGVLLAERQGHERLAHGLDKSRIKEAVFRACQWYATNDMYGVCTFVDGIKSFSLGGSPVETFVSADLARGTGH